MGWASRHGSFQDDWAVLTFGRLSFCCLCLASCNCTRPSSTCLSSLCFILNGKGLLLSEGKEECTWGSEEVRGGVEGGETVLWMCYMREEFIFNFFLKKEKKTRLISTLKSLDEQCLKSCLGILFPASKSVFYLGQKISSDRNLIFKAFV